MPSDWILTQKIGEVPRRHGPFVESHQVEAFLRQYYNLYPGSTCIVVAGIEANDWWPEHGYQWMDVHGDRRRRHPRKSERQKRQRQVDAIMTLIEERLAIVWARPGSREFFEAELRDALHGSEAAE